MVCFGAVLFEGAFALKNEEAIKEGWTSRTRDITDSLASITTSLLGTKDLRSTCRVQGVKKVSQKIHVAIISHFYLESFSRK